MGWFAKPEPEPAESPIVRLASPEFVSGLVEIAEIYEHREKGARARINSIAERLSRATYFNFGDLDRALGEIRGAVNVAFSNMAAASEIRDWIREYEHRGRRPPYMPAPPPSTPPDQDGS